MNALVYLKTTDEIIMQNVPVKEHSFSKYAG